MPQVTAALPVYNGEEYVEEALASLCAQDCADMQILVSDNASTDRTPEILFAWQKKDSRIVIHRQEKNIGAIGNFKWLALNAQTPWISLAAHDDLWSPNFISALYAAAQERKKTVLSVPRMELVKGRERVHDKTYPAPRSFFESSLVKRRCRAIKEANSGWFYGLSHRETLVQSLNAVSTFSFVWGFDFLVLLNFILAGEIAVADEAIYYKQVTEISEDHYRPQTAKDNFRLQKEFWQHEWKILQASSLSFGEKAVLMAPLMRYNRHAGKLKRTLKLALKSGWR